MKLTGNFPGGTWGRGVVKQKTFCRGVWIFSGTAQWAKDHLPLNWRIVKLGIAVFNILRKITLY